MIYKFRDVQTHQAVPLPPGELTIGREDDCQIIIENTSVSRHHATIINRDDGVWVEDLGSSNGTAVRGQMITERTALSVGEVIYFGTACYRLDPEVTGEPEPAPASELHPGLKPAGRHSLMRKTTDRVPLLGTIRFDNPPPAPPSPDNPAPSSSSLPPAPTPTSTATTQPTIALPRVPERSIATPTAASAPVPANPSSPAPPTFAVHPPESAPAPSSTPLLVWFAFGAGLATGLLAGLAIAYAFIRLSGHSG